MDIETLVKENFSLFVIFWPLMKLESIHELQHGSIGPITLLSKKYSALNELTQFLSYTSVDASPIKDPVVAVTSLNPKKLIEEVECITFFACSSETSRAEEEIFGQRHLIALYEKDNQIFINLDEFADGVPIQLLHGAKFQYFPRSYSTWDNDSINDFENFFS